MPHLSIISSLDDLLSQSQRWNRLWCNSDIRTPLARAEMIDLWFRHLSDPKAFRAIVVEEGEELVAALPLEMAFRGPLMLARLPQHPWSSHGELLWNPASDPQATFAAILDGLAQLSVSGFWTDGLNLSSPAWQLLLSEAAKKALPSLTEYQYSVGILRMPAEQNTFVSHLSKNLRKSLKRSKKKLGESGEVSLLQYESDSEGHANLKWQQLFSRGVEVEHANWKGRSGSSIKATAGMRSFFEELCGLLDDSGHLELLLLKSGDQDVAFEFGYTSKGTYFSHKVGYDEQFASWSPGNVLTAEQIASYEEDDYHLAIDTLSPLTPLTLRWSNQLQRRSRLILGQPSLQGRFLVEGYRTLIGAYRWARRKSPQEELALPYSLDESQAKQFGWSDQPTPNSDPQLAAQAS